ncbi:hypothetical protein Avbf_18840 [Armadillidium vulgare]|nr:hypothetical protein Avbf_18840 [Armadillidium vulgare]
MTLNVLRIPITPMKEEEEEDLFPLGEESQNSKSDASRYTESDGGDPDRKKKKNPRRIRNTERLSNLYNKGRKDFVGKRKYVDMRGVTEKEINKMISDGDVSKLEYVVLSGRGGALDGKTSWNDNVKRFLKKVPTYMEQIELLQVYASDGDLDMVKKITRENSKYAMGRNKDGAIALHFAASSGDYDTTKHLLDIYPEGMYVEDRERRVPVHWAALAKNEGHLEVFELLEKKGSYIHACDLIFKDIFFSFLAWKEVQIKYLREEGLLPYAISRANSRRSSQPNSRGQSVTPSRSKSGSPERDKTKSPAETDEKDSPKEEEEEGEASERRSRSRTRKNSKAIEEEEEDGKSRSPSKKGSRSRSKSQGKEESETQTRSKSKSPTPSNSKHPSRSTSKASVRSKSKTPSNTSKPPSNTSKTSKRSKSKSKSPTGSKAKSRSRSRSKTPKKEGEETEGEKDKPKKKKKRKKRPETPEVVKPPHDEEVEQAIRGAENENYKGISKLILQGDGYRLVGATSSNEEVQMFLDDLPDSLKSIKDIQKSIEEGDLRGAQNLLDRKEKAFVRDANQCNLLHTATIHGHTVSVRVTVYYQESFRQGILQMIKKRKKHLRRMRTLEKRRRDEMIREEKRRGEDKRNEQWQRYDKANLLAVPGEEEEDEEEEEEEKEEDKPEEDNKPEEDTKNEDEHNEEIEKEVEDAIKAAEKGKHEPLSNIVRRGDGKFLIGKSQRTKTCKDIF